MRVMVSVPELDTCKCSASRGASCTIFLLGMCSKYLCSDTPLLSLMHTHFKLMTGVCTLSIEHSVFFLVAGLIIEMLF